jgi:hypothetical protein
MDAPYLNVDRLHFVARSENLAKVSPTLHQLQPVAAFRMKGSVSISRDCRPNSLN